MESWRQRCRKRCGAKTDKNQTTVEFVLGAGESTALALRPAPDIRSRSCPAFGTFFQSLSTTPVALSCSSASAPLSPLTANLPSSSPPSGGVDNGGRAEKDRLVVGREPAKSRGLPAEDRKSVERLVGGRAYVVGKCGAVGEDVSLGGRGRHKGAVGEGAEEGGRARNDADWETLARSRPPWGLAVQLNSSAHNIMRLLEQELAWWNPGKDLANPASPAGGWRRPPPSSRGFPLSLTLTQSSQGRYQYVLSQGVDSGR